MIHLHNHTEFSLLDGLPTSEDLIKRAKELNQPALAITDHGNMAGVPFFVKTAKKHDIKPIIGIETYIVDDMSQKESRDNYHFLLIAYNETGYQTLIQLSSDAFLNGYYYRPRIDWEYLNGHNEGLVATTGCLAAPVPQNILIGNETLAKKYLGFSYDIFGRDRLFIELQEHEGIPELRDINSKLLIMGKEFGLRPLATNDVHYARKEDAQLHDILLCVQTKSLVEEEKRMRFSDNSYYLKSHDEMIKTFGKSAVFNTHIVAEMCEPFQIYDPQPKLPKIANNSDELLRKEAHRGLMMRYGIVKASSGEVAERFEHEMSIISSMGFADYFLIIADLCKYAKRNNIWWNVRGSGAGSIVAYSLGITSVCPLQNGLIFERFLNPNRVNLPDIDLDFAHTRREDVVRYLREKYGDDLVSQISTYSYVRSRSAIRDVGRVYNIPLRKVDRLAKLIPFVPGYYIDIEGSLNEDSEYYSYELRQLYDNDPTSKMIIDWAKQIEGHVRHIGIHAAGVVLGDKPLIERLPLTRIPSGKGLGDINTATQWDMKIIDDMSLLKIDFLGLSTLTAMQLCCDAIKERYGVEYTIENIPYLPEHKPQHENNTLDKAFKLLSSGNTIGVFQLENGGMRSILTDMQPTQFTDIVSLVALYRPGPKQFIPDFIRSMHGETTIEKFQSVSDILEDTYGNIVFQEQVMQIAIKVAGYSASEADSIRKAIGKKDSALMQQHKTMFLSGAAKNNISIVEAQQLWDAIEKFADYSFNRAHATDYGKLSVQTAFLKAHYPIEYMYGCLRSEERKDRLKEYVGETLRMGIDILPPDINHSQIDFSIEDTSENFDGDSIRFGLIHLKGVNKAADKIITEREKNGPFKRVDEFIERMKPYKVGKTAVKSLLYSGAFTSVKLSHELACDLADIYETGMTIKDEYFTGIAGTSEIEAKQKAFEMMGVSLNDPIIDVDALTKDMQYTIKGILSSIDTRITNKGEQMAIMQIGNTDVIVFPSMYKEYKSILRTGISATVSGKLTEEGDLIATSIIVTPDKKSLVAPQAIIF